MRYSLKMCIILKNVVLISTIMANPVIRAADAGKKPIITKAPGGHKTPYHPPLLRARVLFVEDPGSDVFGPPVKPDPVWDSVLTEILGADNYGWFGPTSTISEDGPGLDTMQQYELVIWDTYDYWWPDTAGLTVNDQNNIAGYLEAGGKFWLIGLDLLWSGVPMNWLSDYFHLADANQDYVSPADSLYLQGLAEIDSIGFIAIPDYQLNLFYPDELIPDAQAHAVLEDTDGSKVVGIFYSGTGDWTSSFWAMDGRSPDPWNQWVAMVTGMLDAFGVLGTAEMPSQESARKLPLSTAPVPFIHSTTINYILDVAGDVSLQILNTIGQQVITLVDDYKDAGSYQITWNGRDARDVNVPDGIYFVKLDYRGAIFIKKLAVIR